MAMTDKTGKVVWRADELPFGEEYQTEEIPERNDRRFLGKQLDRETGLVYMGTRYLDPRTGRFTQPDPVGLVDPATGKVNRQMLLNPQRLNRYVYGLNNPYRYVDPEGDFAIVGAALIGAAIAYFSHPDIANAPRSASSRTYMSHGARNIALGAVTGGSVGAGAKWVGGMLAARKLSLSQQRAIRSYKRRISEHKQKITTYKTNPDSFDNKGFLRDAPNDEIRKQIINGRIKHLKNEIRVFKKNIKKIRR